MNPKLLLHVLYWTFVMALCFYVGSLFFNVYMNTLWDKSPKETSLPDNSINYTLRKMATIYKEDGFEIPVTMHFFYADTIVQYAGRLNEFTKKQEGWIYSQNNVDNRHWWSSWPSSLDKWEQAVLPRYDTIYQVDTLITRALTQKFREKPYHGGEKVEERYQENIFDLAGLQSHVKSWINVKPKQSKHYLIMLLRANLNTLFYIFLFYQLLMTVTTLKSNFAASKKLYKRVKIVGWALLVFTVFQFLLEYSLKSIYDFIRIESIATSLNHIDGLKLSMSSYLGFNFHIFSAGILLIILSLLMKRSSEIEDSWSLTI